MKKNERTALILIDIQKGMDDIEYWGGGRNNPNAEENAALVLSYWRKKGWPVFHVQHCSTNPRSRLVAGQPGNDIKDIVKPTGEEPVIKKNVNSAFIGTDLQERLDKDGIRTLVMLGLTTDHCVSTTVRMAGNLGYECYLVCDATATFDKVGVDGKKYPAEIIHQTALASLHNEFATVITTHQLLEMME